MEYELRCLRKWIKETESRLKPLNIQLNWTILELEEKAREHEVSHKFRINIADFFFILSVVNLGHLGMVFFKTGNL